MMNNFAKVKSLLEARRPGHTLPQGFYTDLDVFEFDLTAIHGRSWIMAGFEVELPKPGSTLAISVGRSPVVIVRDRSGILRAFHNTCRHRGAQICANGVGHGARLVCPYHGWAYNLDGTLSHNTRMPENFDRSQHGLRPVHLETIAGTVYVCLGDEPPPFAPAIIALPERPFTPLSNHAPCAPVLWSMQGSHVLFTVPRTNVSARCAPFFRYATTQRSIIEWMLPPECSPINAVA